jgi:hypothetical protein
MDFRNMSTGLVRKAARSHGIRTCDTGTRAELIRAILNIEKKNTTKPVPVVERILCCAGEAGMNFMNNFRTLTRHEVR